MRNVVVTGGSRGLGLAIACALAGETYRVIAIARSETPELRDAISDAQRENRGSICLRSFDLSEIAKIAGLVGRLCKEFGPIYGLVNNAGIGTAGLLAMMQNEQIESLVRLNTISPIVLTKYVLRSMMRERTGRIVNIASIVASTGYSGLSVYSATKASMVGFTSSLAREVGALDITVNAVAPGFVKTDMTMEIHGDQSERIARRSALNRLAEPSDVAHAVTFLLSKKARNITGTTVTVDAGNTA